jgi:hypothetical protein
MGAAKKRGSYEQRVFAAIVKEAAEKEAVLVEKEQREKLHTHFLQMSCQIAENRRYLRGGFRTQWDDQNSSKFAS